MKKYLLILLLFGVRYSNLNAQSSPIIDTATLRAKINTDIVPNTTGAVTAYKMNNLLNAVLNVIQRYKTDSIWLYGGHLFYKKYPYTYDLGAVGNACDTCISLQPLYFNDTDFVSPTGPYDGTVRRDVKINPDRFALVTDIFSDSSTTQWKVQVIAGSPKCTDANGNSYLINANPPAKYFCSPDSLTNPFFGKKNKIAKNIGGVLNYFQPAVGDLLDVTNKNSSGTYKYGADSAWHKQNTTDLANGNKLSYAPKFGSTNSQEAYIISNGVNIIEVHPDGTVWFPTFTDSLNRLRHLGITHDGQGIAVPDTALVSIDPILIDSLGRLYMRKSLIDSIRGGLFGGVGGAAVWGTITGTLSAQTDLQTALNAKEAISNKSTSTSLGTSNTLYPSQNAVKVYVDNGLSAKLNGTDTTGNWIGIGWLATLAAKQNAITTGTTSQYFRGDLSLATFPTALPPNGSAGGDLTGTYPNPTIANSAVTNAKIANSTIDLTTKVTGVLSVANGGTGTTTPGIVAGTNITVTGTWPNQTVNSTASGGGTTNKLRATATAGQTAFTFSGLPASTNDYDIFVNGSYINPTYYSASGTTVTFTGGLVAGDVVDYAEKK
jgi:hypothetical protein